VDFSPNRDTRGDLTLQVRPLRLSASTFGGAVFEDVTHPAHCCNNNSENPQSSPPDYSFQPEVVAYAIAAIAAGENPLIVSPTGSGKSHIIADIIRLLREGRKNVLVVTHRREIITQISQKLHALGIRHGVYPGWRRSTADGGRSGRLRTDALDTGHQEQCK
jgi:superfamily II DNA or RNA helicase